ncbi:MAG: phage scaffolding protein [Lawsonibacter sp.]
MISESIKTMLGKDLTAQLETALKGKGKEGRDVDVVCGNDGTFVPADKYDGEKRRASAAESALSAAAAAVKALGGSGDPAKLEEDAATAAAALETLNSDHKQELADLRRDTALRVALSDLVYDPADVMRLLDDVKVEVGEDGQLKTDLAQLLQPIQESKPYLFQEPKPMDQPSLKGANPAPVGGGNPPRQYTMEELGRLSMEEYAAYRAQQNGFPKN